MNPRLQWTATAALLAVAGFLLARTFRGSGSKDLGFFYDESARKLFTAARTGVPPIRGTDGPAEDGVRAVVISTSGKPEDRNSWQIAYLEKYSPELKRQMEAAQAGGPSPSMGRAEAMSHRFVRLTTETNWHGMDSPEAEAILNSWAVPGPHGVTPVICSP